MSSPMVTAATPADRERVVTTVVAAFAADPAFRHFFPADDTYAEQAASFAGYLFDRRIASGTGWVVEGGAAVSLWDPPMAPRPGPEAVPALVLPPDTLARLSTYDRAVHAAFPDEPFWYLGVLASHPDQAGRRLGRAVMAAGLDRAVRDGLPAYLETATAANVAMYERSGWIVAQTVSVGPLQMRVMRHPGGTRGTSAAGLTP